MDSIFICFLNHSYNIREVSIAEWNNFRWCMQILSSSVHGEITHKDLQYFNSIDIQGDTTRTLIDG